VYEAAREEWLIEGYLRALTRFRTATKTEKAARQARIRRGRSRIHARRRTRCL